jgi:hypothetical protein
MLLLFENIINKKGLYLFYHISMSGAGKIVVFDLDQTLGCFNEIGIFWSALNKILNYHTNQRFFEVMNTFPEFLRPKILTLLKTILNKKRHGKCDKIIIYTNNSGPKEWVQMIADYFEHIFGEKVFEVIHAFKYSNTTNALCKRIENKNIIDLLCCAKVPPETKICFLDDMYHPLMKVSNVYYIKIKPFYFSVSYLIMAKRYCDLYIDLLEHPSAVNDIVVYMEKYTYSVINKSATETEVDEIVGKQMLIHINKFFDN